MGVIDWIGSFFNKDNVMSLDVVCAGISTEIFYKELAIQCCVNLISNSVSRSEFLTYENGKEVRKDNYYLFNVEPNQNKSSSKFWRDVVHKLVYENECLIIQNNNMLYVADSYAADKYAFYENIYKDIVVGELQLQKKYLESEVFHLELHNEKIKTLIDGLYKDYGKLIAYSKDDYKRKNARRGVVEISSQYSQTEESQKDLKDLLSSRFKTFFEAEGGAIIPISEGLKYTDLNSNGYKSGSDSRDIRALVDDIFDYVAMAFQIPVGLLKGDLADIEKQTNNFLTFCVNPIAELITDEINRKYYKKDNYLKRTYVKLDTSRIKAVDITSIASSLDILFRIGANTINDNLRLLGREIIDEPWANERFVTKNYQSLKQLSKGGE